MLSIGQMTKLASAAYDVAVERYGAAHALPVLEILSGGMMKFASVGGQDLHAYFEVCDQQAMQDYRYLCKVAGLRPRQSWDFATYYGDNPFRFAMACSGIPELEKVANVLSAATKAVANTASSVATGAAKGGKSAIKAQRKAFIAQVGERTPNMSGQAAQQQAARTARNQTIAQHTQAVQKPRGSFSALNAHQGGPTQGVKVYRDASGKVLKPNQVTPHMQQAAASGQTNLRRGATVNQPFQATEVQKQFAAMTPAEREAFKAQKMEAARAKGTIKSDTGTSLQVASPNMGRSQAAPASGSKAQRRAQHREAQRVIGGAEQMAQRATNLNNAAPAMRQRANQISKNEYYTNQTAEQRALPKAQQRAQAQQHAQAQQQRVQAAPRNQPVSSDAAARGTGQGRTPDQVQAESSSWGVPQAWKDKARGAWAAAKPWAVPTAIAGGVGVGGYAAYNAARGGAQDQHAQQQQYYPQGYSY